MKKYLLILTLMFFSSCETFNKLQNGRIPSSEKIKHYVISIHGLGGKPESLGELMPLLKVHLESIDPQAEVITKNFSYSTGVKEADVERFVSELENYLIKELPDVTADSADRITLITHSQGGLVGTLWYLKSISGVDLKQKLYAQKISGFVALGVPFWGSRTTFVVKDFVPNEYLQKTIFSALKISDQEVTDITASSQKIHSYFSTFASRNYVNMSYDPRMLNIIGVVPDEKPAPEEKSFLSFFTDIKNKATRIFDARLNMGIRWESDQALNTSSGRLGFHYYSDTLYQQVLEKKPDQVTIQDFNYSRFFKKDQEVVFVEAVHSYASNHPKYALAQVPEACYIATECEQPAYVYILKHVANCESPANTCNMSRYRELLSLLEIGRQKLSRQSSDDIKAEMRTFNLGFDIVLPKNFVPPKDLIDSKTLSKYITVDYVRGHTEEQNLKDPSEDGLVRSSPKQSYEIRIGRFKEWSSRIVNYNAETNQINIQLTGNIQPKNKQLALDVNKQYPLQMVIQIPGLKKRKLTIPLQPSYTTFLDLQLD